MKKDLENKVLKALEEIHEKTSEFNFKGSVREIFMKCGISQDYTYKITKVLGNLGILVNLGSNKSPRWMWNKAKAAPNFIMASMLLAKVRDKEIVKYTKKVEAAKKESTPIEKRDVKRCPKCGRELPLGSFYKKASTKDGLSCWCKDCCKEANKATAEKAKEARRNKPEVAKEKAPAKEKAVWTKDVSKFSDAELIAELVSRDYKIRKRASVKIGKLIISF